MGENALPKAWESLMNSSSYIPVIMKSIDNIYDAGWSMEPNKHDFFEMVYFKKGTAVFLIEDEPVELGPDDIIIIKPNRTHKLIVKSKTGVEFIVLSFKFGSRAEKADFKSASEHRINDQSEQVKAAIFEKAKVQNSEVENTQKEESYSEVSLEEFLNFVKGRESGTYITLNVVQKNEIILLLERILKERVSSEIGSDYLANLYILQLFVMISRALKVEWEKSIEGKSPKIKSLIDSSIEYIQNNFEKDPTLDDISKYVFLSASYFARAFKEQTGKSPMNYLQEVKIRRAKELLADSDKKAGEIAFEVGFSSQQRFNNVFKKSTGLTPIQFKNSLLKNSLLQNSLRKVKKH